MATLTEIKRILNKASAILAALNGGTPQEDVSRGMLFLSNPRLDLIFNWMNPPGQLRLRINDRKGHFEELKDISSEQ